MATMKFEVSPFSLDGNGIGNPTPSIPFLIVLDWSNYNKRNLLFKG